MILAKLAILGGSADSLLFAQLFSDCFEDIIVFCTNRKEKESVKKRVVLTNGNKIVLSEKFRYAYDLDEFSEHSYIFLFAEYTDVDKFAQIIKKLIPILKPEHHYQFLLGSTGLLKKSLRQKHKIFCASEYLKGLLQQNQLEHHSIGFIVGFAHIREVFNQKAVAFQIITDPSELANSIHQHLRHDKISWILDRNQPDSFRSIMKMEIHSIIFDIIATVSYQLKQIENLGLSATSLLLEICIKELLLIVACLRVESAELMISSQFFRSLLQTFHETKRDKSLATKRKKKEGGIFMHILRRWFVDSTGYLGEPLVQQPEQRLSGAVHVARILEFAKEEQLELPFLKKVFEVLFHNKDRNTFLAHLNDMFQTNLWQKSEHSGSNQSSTIPMLYSIAGRHLEHILIQRINDRFLQDYANGEKIKNQANMIAEITQRRIRKMDKRRIFSLRREYLIEHKLWQAIQTSPVQKLERTFNRLIQFYIRDITDNFKPGIKTILYLLHFPIRFTLNIIQRSRWPIIEGAFDAIQPLLKNTTFVYVPTHKSHLDSLEITLALLQKKYPIPRYAAASSLMTKRFWSLILRILGAFSVDRERSHNILYLECLRHYSETLLQFGIPSLIFPEGTRSRNGSLSQIKTGLLSSVLEAFRNNQREIAVIPVSIDYSSIPEDQEFCQLKKSTHLSRYLLQRRKVILHFSKPIFVSQFSRASDGKNKLAQQIAMSWKQNQTVLKNHLLAHLLDAMLQENVKETTLIFAKSEFIARIEKFLIENAHKKFETKDYDTIINRGMGELIRNQILVQEESSFKGDDEIIKCIILSPVLLKYYGTMALEKHNEYMNKGQAKTEEKVQEQLGFKPKPGP